MSNEILFFTLLFVMLAATLLAFRLGRAYVFALIAAEVALMNIFVVKQFDFLGLAVTGGNVLYGGIFLATDLLNEHYGKRIAEKAVWAGFGAGIFMLITASITTAFKPNDFDIAQSAFETIFSPTFRIVVGSLASYMIFQSFDVWFYDWLKKATDGKHLWLRNNLSTIISQAGDSLFFTTVGLLSIPAFEGKSWLVGFVPAEAFWDVVFFTLAMKIVVALLDTPIVYLSKKIKHEGLGITDRIHKFLD